MVDHLVGMELGVSANRCETIELPDLVEALLAPAAPNATDNATIDEDPFDGKSTAAAGEVTFDDVF